MTRMFCTEVQTNPNEYQYHNCFRVFVLERGDLNREKLLANLKFQTGGFTGGGGDLYMRSCFLVDLSNTTH